MHMKGNMGLQYSYVKCCGNLRCALRHDGYGYISCYVMLCIVNCKLDLYIVPYWMTVEQDMEKSRSQSMLRCFSILSLDYDVDHILVLAGGQEPHRLWDEENISAPAKFRILTVNLMPITPVTKPTRLVNTTVMTRLSRVISPCWLLLCLFKQLKILQFMYLSKTLGPSVW